MTLKYQTSVIGGSNSPAFLGGESENRLFGFVRHPDKKDEVSGTNNEKVRTYMLNYWTNL